MWSGWVAIVDKEKSKTYTKLVKKSEFIINDLPWDKNMEKSKFMAPDFSSLDVVTFAGDRLPSGINIPNYYDVREKDGFKNVVFQNREDQIKNGNQTKFNFMLSHVKDKEESDLISTY